MGVRNGMGTGQAKNEVPGEPWEVWEAPAGSGLS